MNLTKLKTKLNAQSITLTQVVAFDNKNAIGKNNQLAWHIPEDLKHFKEITTGGIVIMGRKTFESMGKALPNRINYVITRDKNFSADNIKIAHSIESALELASNDIIHSEKKSLFIIGGGEIYRQTLPLADRLETTQVDLQINGDAFYPNIGNDFEQIWQSEKQICAKNGISFTFSTWQRKQS